MKFEIRFDLRGRHYQADSRRSTRTVYRNGLEKDVIPEVHEEMDILSVLKSEASKLQQQLDTVNSAIKVLGGRNSFGRARRKWHMSASAKARMAYPAATVRIEKTDKTGRAKS